MHSFNFALHSFRVQIEPGLSSQILGIEEQVIPPPGLDSKFLFVAQFEGPTFTEDEIEYLNGQLTDFSLQHTSIYSPRCQRAQTAPLIMLVDYFAPATSDLAVTHDVRNFLANELQVAYVDMPGIVLASRTFLLSLQAPEVSRTSQGLFTWIHTFVLTTDDVLVAHDLSALDEIVSILNRFLNEEDLSVRLNVHKHRAFSFEVTGMRLDFMLIDQTGDVIAESVMNFLDANVHAFDSISM